MSSIINKGHFGKNKTIFSLEFRGKILKTLIRLYRNLMLLYALPCPVMKDLAIT